MGWFAECPQWVLAGTLAEELIKKIDKATSEFKNDAKENTKKLNLITNILVAYGAVGAMGLMISAANMIGFFK